MLLEINGIPSVLLELGQLYLLGKETNGDKKKSKIFIDLENGENISKRHCVIETNRNEQAFVYDLFSFSGTILNNKVLESMKKTLLKNGDILKIGGKEIKYIHNGHEMSGDSSGFLEVPKHTSDISLSPDLTSQAQNRLKPSDDHNFLKPTRLSTSFSSSRSDSFAIPGTQPCKPRNSLNDSSLSNANKSDGKIRFNFGNLDSFGDDDLCIPETQELVTLGDNSSGQRPRPLADIQHKAEQASILNEEPSTLENGTINEGSQFRICTQDYNEGFGEEETSDSLHSQIIPIIKHSQVILNRTVHSSNANSITEIRLQQEEKEMSALKWQNSNADRETTKVRTDCVTPDIFDFEVNENDNVLDEDEEDLLPTQRVLPVLKKVEDKSLLNEVEKPCVEKDCEEVLTLSDKENRCPARIVPITDMPETQILEARCHTSISHINSISSAIKASSSEGNKNSLSLLNMGLDEEDDLLTQAFIQPKNIPVNSSSLPSKNFSKCFNSTLLDDKCTEKAPATFNATASVFKKPDTDLGILKKISSTSSTASENDIDLLMCTPQLIKDNLTVGKSEDLRKHILAVKNIHLFGDDTEDDDDDDESNNLVKLINVPKNSLDFDNLLPHLNGKPDANKEEYDEQREAHKLYKFNISFGKEQNERQSKTSNTKSSSYSRDERHAARDRERETSERINNKATTKRLEKVLANEKEKDKKKERIENKNSRGKKKESEKKENKRKLKDNERKPNKTEEIQSDDKVQASVASKNNEEINSGIESTTTTTDRLRKIQFSNENSKQEAQTEDKKKKPTPARRLTRSKIRFEEISPLSNMEGKGDDMDSISTQPTVNTKRIRSRSKQNDAQTTTETSTSSTKSNEVKINKIEEHDGANSKKNLRKRKSEAPTAVIPAKLERKTLRNTHAEESTPPSLPHMAISISTTNVDHQLIKDLLRNSKGLWNIAANAADSAILVMDKPLRTFKFLLAMARGIPIVTSEYLKKLNKCKSAKEVNLKDYQFADSEFEKKYKFSFVKSLQVAKKQRIFKDYEFLMTANILPIPQEIKAIIEVSGGYVHNKNPPPLKENQKLYLVTTKEDKKDWHKYRRLNKKIIIVSTEAIMSAIMSQSSETMKSFTMA